MQRLVEIGYLQGFAGRALWVVPSRVGVGAAQVDHCGDAMVFQQGLNMPSIHLRRTEQAIIDPVRVIGARQNEVPGGQMNILQPGVSQSVVFGLASIPVTRSPGRRGFDRGLWNS